MLKTWQSYNFKNFLLVNNDPILTVMTCDLWLLCNVIKNVPHWIALTLAEHKSDHLGEVGIKYKLLYQSFSICPNFAKYIQKKLHTDLYFVVFFWSNAHMLISIIDVLTVKRSDFLSVVKVNQHMKNSICFLHLLFEGIPWSKVNFCNKVII